MYSAPRAVVLAALAVVALTILSAANAHAAPQVQIPSIPNLPLPGNGNNNGGNNNGGGNNGGNNGGNSPAPAQPQENECETKGKCVPPGKSKTCIVPSSQWRFKDFEKAYLPVDLSPYFKDRFDNFDASTFPRELRNSSDLMELWGNKPWSYFGAQWKEFNRKQAGCELPTQRYYLTWAMIDMFEYFQSKGDHCASGANIQVCADTLDKRAERVVEDIKNKTLCSGPKEYEEAANKYIQRLKTHPFRSTATGSCISGAKAEQDLNKCGFYTEFAACQFKDGCPDIDADLEKRCPKVLADFRIAYQIEQKEEAAAAAAGGSNKGLIAGIVIGIVVFAILIGLCMLKRTRVKSSNLKETLGRMTFGRTFGRQQSQSNVNAQDPPPPQIHFANSTPAGVAAPNMVQQQPQYVPQDQHNQQQHDTAHLIPQKQPQFQQQPPAYQQPSPMASPHFSPRVSSSPAPATPMADAPLAAGAAAAGIVYVDEYGRPMSTVMSPMSGPMVAPIATQPAFIGGEQQQQQQYYSHQQPAHDHSGVLTTTPSSAALVAPTASDAADSQQMLTLTSTQIDTHTHTTHASQVHHQVQEETHVTTTTAIEEFVVYIDENGNPCDEQGNPLPEDMPEVMAMRAAQRGEAGVSMGTR